MNVSGFVTTMSVLALLGGSCSLAPRETITIEEAEQRTEDYVRQALALLPAHARTEVDPREPSVGCGDAAFGTSGLENVAFRHQIHGLRVSEYPKYFHRLEQWWRDNGFDDQIEDERPTRESVLAYHGEGYRMRILHEEGELLLITISECVWPDGTPE